MIFRARVIFLLICIATFEVNAGAIKKGVWQAESCGVKPVAPQLNYDSIPEMNDSIAAMNAWQEQTVVYFECVAKEANSDVKAINDSVSAEQNEHKEFVERTNAEVAGVQQRVAEEQAAKKLESQ